MKNIFSTREWIVIGAIVVVLAFIFCGCTTERKQMQLVSDARAGAMAYKNATPEQKQKIADGVADNVLGATSNIPKLVKPSISVEEILKDPESYTKSAAISEAHPPPYVNADVPHTGPGPAEILRGIGSQIMFWSSWIGGIGLIFILIICFGPAIAFLANPIVWQVVKLAVSLGTAGMIIGSALIWLSDYLWIIVLVSILAGIGVAIAHWNDVKAGYTKIKDKIKSKAQQTLEGKKQ